MRTPIVSTQASKIAETFRRSEIAPRPSAPRPVSYDRDALLAPARSVPLARDSAAPLSAQDLGFATRELAPGAEAASSGVSGSASPSAALHGGAAVQSTIHLDGNVDLNQLSLTLDLSHRDVNGLTVSLTSPSGKTVQLPIVSAHSMGGTLDLSSAFAGEPAQGDWTLSVTDSMKRDSGSLARWSLSGQGTPVSDGKIALYPMPDSGPTPILNTINAAQKTLDLSCYLITDQKVMDALKAAAARGVTVRVMMEPKLVSPAGGKTYQQKIDELTAAGVQAQATPPAFDSAGNVDHAKFLIADGQTLMLGTGNLVKTGLGDTLKSSASRANRDLWITDTRAESAREAEEIFQADWLRQPTTGDDFQNLIVTPDNADGRLLALIDSAKTRLYVDNQELEDSTVIDHLIAAKQRGVDVEVLCASPASKTSKDKNGPAVAKLQAAGVKALEVSHYYMHAKAIIADDQAFIGSQNFSTDGMKRNRELGDFFDQADVVTQLASMFQIDYQNGVAAAAKKQAQQK